MATVDQILAAQKAAEKAISSPNRHPSWTNHDNHRDDKIKTTRADNRTSGEANIVQFIQEHRNLAPWLAVVLRSEFGMHVAAESALKYMDPDAYDTIKRLWPRCDDYKVIKVAKWETENGRPETGDKAYVMIERIKDKRKYNFLVTSVGKDGDYVRLPDGFTMAKWQEGEEARDALWAAELEESSKATFAEEFKIYENLFSDDINTLSEDYSDAYDALTNVQDFIEDRASVQNAQQYGDYSITLTCTLFTDFDTFANEVYAFGSRNNVDVSVEVLRRSDRSCSVNVNLTYEG